MLSVICVWGSILDHLAQVPCTYDASRIDCARSYRWLFLAYWFIRPALDWASRTDLFRFHKLYKYINTILGSCLFLSYFSRSSRWQSFPFQVDQAPMTRWCNDKILNCGFYPFVLFCHITFVYFCVTMTKTNGKDKDKQTKRLNLCHIFDKGMKMVVESVMHRFSPFFHRFSPVPSLV